MVDNFVWSVNAVINSQMDLGRKEAPHPFSNDCSPASCLVDIVFPSGILDKTLASSAAVSGL